MKAELKGQVGVLLARLDALREEIAPVKKPMLEFEFDRVLRAATKLRETADAQEEVAQAMLAELRTLRAWCDEGKRRTFMSLSPIRARLDALLVRAQGVGL